MPDLWMSTKLSRIEPEQNPKVYNRIYLYPIGILPEIRHPFKHYNIHEKHPLLNFSTPSSRS